MTGRLQGRVAIVTGAAQGIGASFAKGLADEGAAVVASDILDAKPVTRAIEKAGGRALALCSDVTDAGSTRVMVEESLSAFGKIDILVANAAIFGNLIFKQLTDIESTEWAQVMEVNVRGVFECVKAVTPAMRERKYGKIVTIASATVFKGAPMLLHYVTSKGAVVAMTRCLARELGGDGIRVNALAPGLVMSENIVANPAYKAAVVDNNTAARAIKKELYPVDLIGSLVHLCSSESDSVTGQVMVVDGGSVMR